jgi:hypothetical protein
MGDISSRQARCLSSTESLEREAAGDPFWQENAGCVRGRDWKTSMTPLSRTFSNGSGSTCGGFDNMHVTPNLVAWEAFAPFRKVRSFATQNLSEQIWNQSWARIAESVRASRRSELPVRSSSPDLARRPQQRKGWGNNSRILWRGPETADRFVDLNLLIPVARVPVAFRSTTMT